MLEFSFLVFWWRNYIWKFSNSMDGSNVGIGKKFCSPKWLGRRIKRGINKKMIAEILIDSIGSVLGSTLVEKFFLKKDKKKEEDKQKEDKNPKSTNK